MPWPIDALPYPFELGFMQRALVAGVVVGVFAPMIGTFVVQKRMSLIGDGIGHLAFAGVGAGLVAGVSPIWAALVVAIAGALGIEWLRSRRSASRATRSRTRRSPTTSPSSRCGTSAAKPPTSSATSRSTPAPCRGRT